eukprot:scaffold65926_cov57-Phaeocystis_antarctica.AAC.2
MGGCGFSMSARVKECRGHGRGTAEQAGHRQDGDWSGQSYHPENRRHGARRDLNLAPLVPDDDYLSTIAIVDTFGASARADATLPANNAARKLVCHRLRASTPVAPSAPESTSQNSSAPSDGLRARLTLELRAGLASLAPSDASAKLTSCAAAPPLLRPLLTPTPLPRARVARGSQRSRPCREARGRAPATPPIARPHRSPCDLRCRRCRRWPSRGSVRATTHAETPLSWQTQTRGALRYPGTASTLSARHDAAAPTAAPPWIALSY